MGRANLPSSAFKIAEIIDQPSTSFGSAGEIAFPERKGDMCIINGLPVFTIKVIDHAAMPGHCKRNAIYSWQTNSGAATCIGNKQAVMGRDVQTFPIRRPE